MDKKTTTPALQPPKTEKQRDLFGEEMGGFSSSLGIGELREGGEGMIGDFRVTVLRFIQRLAKDEIVEGEEHSSPLRTLQRGMPKIKKIR